MSERVPLGAPLAHSRHVHAWAHHECFPLAVRSFARSFGFRACQSVLFVFCPKNRSHNGPGQPMVCVNNNRTATNRSAVEGLSGVVDRDFIHTSRPSLFFSRSLACSADKIILDQVVVVVILCHHAASLSLDRGPCPRSLFIQLDSRALCLLKSRVGSLHALNICLSLLFFFCYFLQNSFSHRHCRNVGK